MMTTYRTYLLVTRLAVSALLGSSATSGLVDDVAGVDGFLVILLYVAVRLFISEALGFCIPS